MSCTENRKENGNDIIALLKKEKNFANKSFMGKLEMKDSQNKNDKNGKNPFKLIVLLCFSASRKLKDFFSLHI